MAGILVTSDHDVGSFCEPPRFRLVDLGDRPRRTKEKGEARHDDLLPALIGG
jgi:hypothetical protein